MPRRARLASQARAMASPRHVIHFGDQEYAVALTGNHAAINSSERPLLYPSAVSINVIPSERPVRSASSSPASGCLPSPRCQEPCPSAGTTVPSWNFTLRPPTFELTPVAAAKSDPPDSPADIALTDIIASPTLRDI